MSMFWDNLRIEYATDVDFREAYDVTSELIQTLDGIANASAD